MIGESLFHDALARPPEERAGFLTAACRGNPELRKAVAALLAAHDASGEFLDKPHAEFNQTDDIRAQSVLSTRSIFKDGNGPETIIANRYTLLERIGEGGMGEVWVARQTEPVKRKVALKLIKKGMDSKAVLARFEHERQALAMMDHPNIARVLDGGVTPSGQPFFVMELVNGLPLNKFCDEAKLTPRERLELFVPVCQAIQHAHQKGIIHRDLKPANILVTLLDGKGLPKVIDFGVAKATHGKLTEESMNTQFGSIVGTLEYMAPEQAGYSAEDIDTRADIYSLGVVLYELLTGLKPIDAKRLKSTALLEMIRVIKEDEPAKPSTRLSTDKSMRSLAALRHTEPAKLMAMLRGELDWVVMKCLEKRRDRRYESANGLTRDIERYLANLPVEARPASTAYRFSKFLQRNKGWVVAASLLVLALLGGIVGTSVGMVQAQSARLQEASARKQADDVRADRDARAAQVNRDINFALNRAIELREQSKAATADSAALFAQAREQAERAVALVENSPGDTALAAEVRQLQSELNEEDKDRKLLAALEEAELAKAETTSENRFPAERAIPLFREAFRAFGLRADETSVSAAAELIRRRSAPIQAEIFSAMAEWGDLAAIRRDPHTHWILAVLNAAEPENAFGRQVRTALGEKDILTRKAALENLAESADVEKVPARDLLRLASRLDTASQVKLLRRAQPRYPSDFWINQDLGLALIYLSAEKLDSIRFLTAAHALRPSSTGVLINLGNALRTNRQLEESNACYRKAIEIDPNYAAAYGGLAQGLNETGLLDEALKMCRKAVELDPKSGRVYSLLGTILAKKDETDESIVCFRQAVTLDPKDQSTWNLLGLALCENRQFDPAIECFKKLIELDPVEAGGYSNWGNVLAAKGLHGEAISKFKKAIELNPKEARYHHNLSCELDNTGRMDEAITAAKKSIELDPTNIEWCYRLAKMLNKKNKLDDAIPYFRTATAPGTPYAANAEAHYDLGSALAQTGHPEEAAASLRKAIALKPDFAYAHSNLGIVLSNMGKLDESIASYRRALEIDPKLTPALTNLGIVLAGKAQWNEAAACFEKLVAVEPAHDMAHAMLGEAFFKTGKYTEAKAAFARALELLPAESPQRAEVSRLVHECERKLKP